MAKRQTNRKVTINFGGRDTTNPLTLLQAVEETFRPKEIEINATNPQESRERDLSETIANQELESLARDRVAKVLDARDAEETTIRIDTGSTPMADRARKRASAENYVADLIGAGWSVFVTVVSTLKTLKDLKP